VSDTSRWVAGVDGCRAGWVVVWHPLDAKQSARVAIFATFADVLAMPEKPAIIAIDIPIGLPGITGPGGRSCDAEVRKFLGVRASSLFSVPSRSAVYSADYGAACAEAARTSDPPRKISKQAFNLFPKMREVDALMTPDIQGRVVECHPEFAFLRLNGSLALEHSKKSLHGAQLRRDLLVRAGYPSNVFDRVSFRKMDACEDDVIDAFAAASVACDILHGKAQRVPEYPEIDSKGLRMEIWG
jgi:predicted RNase H-like nuclease